MKSSRPILTYVIALVALFFGLAGLTHAAPIIVTSLADDGGAGELRAAITTANSNAGSTITFQSGLAGTITLTSPLPQVLVSMTITGPGASSLTIDGNKSYRAFKLGANVAGASATVAISGLTFQNCSDRADTLGGAVILQSSLVTMTLSDCTLTNNIVTATSHGGALCSNGPLTVSNCLFTNNSAPSNGGAALD